MKKIIRNIMNDPKFLRVPYAQSVHGQEEIDAVVNVLKTSTQYGEACH